MNRYFYFFITYLSISLGLLLLVALYPRSEKNIYIQAPFSFAFSTRDVALRYGLDDIKIDKKSFVYKGF